MTTETCNICNGTGWVLIREEDVEKARKCECRAEDILLNRGERANIPPRFLGIGLEWGFQPDPQNPSQSRAKNLAQKFIHEYPAVEKGLLFQGGAGVGKTTILCSIGYELLKTKNVDAFYIDWNELIRLMRSGDHHMTKDFSSINDLIEKLSVVELLLFDELGATGQDKLTPWIFDSIYYIINKRYNNNKITVCATNYFDAAECANMEEQLARRVGERIRSRLYEMTSIIKIKGSDFRRKHLSK